MIGHFTLKKNIVFPKELKYKYCAWLYLIDLVDLVIAV